ncbi:hypothetical protein GCM10023238_13380 [Streptomyces heliomycini]
MGGRNAPVNQPRSRGEAVQGSVRIADHASIVHPPLTIGPGDRTGAVGPRDNGRMAESREERARHWRYDELPGVDLLRARYIRKTFVRHTHEHFVIAAIADGVEVFHHGGGDQYAGAGALAW